MYVVCECYDKWMEVLVLYITITNVIRDLYSMLSVFKQKLYINIFTREGSNNEINNNWAII